jgi:hypothetical protein
MNKDLHDSLNAHLAHEFEAFHLACLNTGNGCAPSMAIGTVSLEIITKEGVDLRPIPLAS